MKEVDIRKVMKEKQTDAPNNVLEDRKFTTVVFRKKRDQTEKKNRGKGAR